MDRAALAQIIDDRVANMIDNTRVTGRDRQEQLDTAELLAALRRILLGKSVDAAFGAPGDWGYDTPIGKALAAVVPLEPARLAIERVIRQRAKQDEKWGEQNHDAGTWALILIEEIGEWAEANLHAQFGGPAAAKRLTEAVHVAAVALAVVECMLRADAQQQGE